MTIDIHCHPSLKTYLFANSFLSPDLTRSHYTSPESNYLSLTVDIPSMKEGDVRVAVASHYVPERELINESSILTSATHILNIFWKKIVEKIEKNGNDGQAVFAQTIESINIFEQKVNSARSSSENVAVAHSAEEFEKMLKENTTVFLHSVEGAHCLGRNLQNNSNRSEAYLRNLEVLFERGVCMLTLGHFYDNDLVSPPEGIPPSTRKILDKHKPKDLSKGLSAIGEDVVRRMLEKGMIIDLLHTTPPVREKIFKINEESGSPRRPIIFSHSGVQKKFSNQEYPDDKYLNPSEQDIKNVQHCNGVIGIIFMNYWLSGRDDRTFLKEPAMEYIYNTIESIHSTTKTYENISIGTDFDGMNDPSDDLFNYSLLPKLREYLQKKKIKDNDIEKIFYGNALRVIREGWGK